MSRKSSCPTLPCSVDPETLAIALAPLAKIAPSRTETILEFVKSTLDPWTTIEADVSWIDEAG